MDEIIIDRSKESQGFIKRYRRGKLLGKVQVARLIIDYMSALKFQTCHLISSLFLPRPRGVHATGRLCQVLRDDESRLGAHICRQSGTQEYTAEVQRQEEGPSLGMLRSRGVRGCVSEWAEACAESQCFVSGA